MLIYVFLNLNSIKLSRRSLIVRNFAESNEMKPDTYLQNCQIFSKTYKLFDNYSGSQISPSRAYTKQLNHRLIISLNVITVPSHESPPVLRSIWAQSTADMRTAAWEHNVPSILNWNTNLRNIKHINEKNT